jgi:hypothetical protein
MRDILSRRSVLGLALMLAACSSAVPTPASPSSASPTAAATPSPTPEPTAPALTETFESPMMGYAVQYPAGWTPTAATELWTPDAANFWDDPVGDRLENGTAGFRGTSQPLAKDQTPAEWLADYLASGPQVDCGEQEHVPVGDAAGTITLNGCAGQGRLGGQVFDVAVVSGGRGYDFTMEGAVDHAFFLAMLATVTFQPKRAAQP